MKLFLIILLILASVYIICLFIFFTILNYFSNNGIDSNNHEDHYGE